MKTRILGLDTGTNSLGWAVVDRDENNQYTPICRGDLIFTEGVKQEKGIEFSLAAERTSYRASRRHYFRRRLRKVEVLKVLVKHKLCPPLSDEALHQFLNVQFVISRCILEDGTLLIPGRETILKQGMQIHLVCAEKDAERISELLGELIEVGHEEKIESEQYVSRRLVVTRPEINGKTFAQLHVSSLYGVNVTRVTRHGMDILIIAVAHGKVPFIIRVECGRFSGRR